MSGSLRDWLRVYLIMGEMESKGKRTEEVLEAALEGGVTCFQFREKKMPIPEQLALGRRLRALCRKRGVPFLVNDRVDVAMLLEADGVHLGQDDVPCLEARRLLGPGKVIGVSAGNWDEVRSALAQKPDYLSVGPVYATSTKPDAGAPIGTLLIRELKASTDVPIVGIGGIHAANAAAVMIAGADGVAVVSAIADQPDPAQAARLLVQAVRRYAKN